MRTIFSKSFLASVPLASWLCLQVLASAAWAQQPCCLRVIECNGATDGTQIETAIAQTASPRAIVINPGTCVLDQTVDVPAETTIRGHGPSATILKLLSTVNGNAIQGFPGQLQQNITISDLAVDQNRGAQKTLGHGIGFGSALGTVSDIRIERVVVRNAESYGIGFQAGSFQKILLNDVQVSNSGRDGIDFKNNNSLNREIVMSNIRVSDFGIDEQLTPGVLVGGQAGIDIRGIALLSNVWVERIRTDQTGIRFRADSFTNGGGAVQSSLSNFRVSGLASTGGVGVEIANRDNNIAGGLARDLAIGVSVFSQTESGLETKAINNSISSVECVQCGIGLRVGFQAGTSGEMNTRIVAFRSRHTGNSGTGLEINGVDNMIVGVQVNGAAVGLNILSTSTRTIVKGATLIGNSTNLIAGGTGTIID